jgi:hypothetical protein
MLSFTPASVSSSTMLRASGRERASLSSLVTTSVSPDRHAAMASRRPGRGPVGAGQPVVDVDPVRLDPERSERVALGGLGGEVLRIGTAPRVPDEHPGHRMTVPDRLPCRHRALLRAGLRGHRLAGQS